MIQRFKNHFLVAALYGFFAIGLLAPFAAEDRIPQANDMQNHLFLILEADRALHEGQFPPRVSPTQHHGWGYPEFQFYSSLPYTVGALLYRTAAFHNAYEALKMTFWCGFVLAGLGLYGCAKQLGVRSSAAFVAGLAYMTSPYLLFNMVIRSHLTEFFAQGLIPFFMWAAFRLYQKPTLGRGIATSALLFSLALTHHITFLYGMLFCGLLLVLDAWAQGKSAWGSSIRGLAAVAAAMCWSLVLAAYLYVPILSYRYSLYITSFTNPFHQFYIALPALLALGPVLIPNIVFSDSPPHFAPSAGLFFFLALGILIWERMGIDRKKSTLGLRCPVFCQAVGASFFVALFLSWSPFNFWQWLPRALWFIQFPFRFLTYVSFFGALMVAFAVEAIERDRDVSQARILGAIAVLLLAAYPWLQVTEKQRAYDPQREANGPSALAAGYQDYLFCPHPFLTRSSDFTNRDFSKEEFEREIAPPQPLNDLLRGTANPLATLNGLLERSDLFRLIDPDSKVLPPNINALWRRIRDSQAVLSLDERRKLNRTLLMLRYPKTFSSLYLPSLETTPPLTRQALDLIVDQTAPFFKREGGAQVGSLLLTRPSYVQLPVLNYPHLLSIRVDDHEMQGVSSYAEDHLDDHWMQVELLSLQLPAGLHRIRVEFRGHRLANRVSATALLLSLGAAVFAL